MKRRAMSRIGPAVGLCLLALLATQPETAAASWLDGPVSQWNTAGMAVPKAPAVQSPNPNCGKDERAASGRAEQQVAAAGWKLEQYWPAQTFGPLTAVTATGGYDGMCRPMGFNVLVFDNGTFAGTIAPAPMNSREDGQLQVTGSKSSVAATPDGALTASFVRYAPTDPLCCPSKGATPVRFRLDTVNGKPVLLAVQIGTSTPAALPKAGGGGGQPQPWPIAAGLALGVFASAGWALSRRFDRS